MNSKLFFSFSNLNNFISLLQISGSTFFLKLLDEFFFIGHIIYWVQCKTPFF
jgi:hypothetical protein